jgi:lantibiotic modifying enzyme
MSVEPRSPVDLRTRTWKPILDGDDAERARKALGTVAEALSEQAGELLETRDASRRPSLAGGDAGIGLFFAYLALATEDETEADRWADEALRFVDRAADALSASVTPPELYSGFTGVAWTLEHLDGLLFENDGDGQEPIDEVLIDYLDSPAASLEYDIIQGLTGFGVYALERGARPTAVRCLEKVVRRLGETATRDEEGVRWFSSPERLPEHQREEYTEGNFNAGVAHGLPGVLPVLAGAVAAGVAEAEARELLEGAVAWLLSHRLDPEEHSGCHLPYAWNPDGGSKGPSRTAWCYGDPGAAAALHCAARRVDRADWAAEAVTMALDATRRPPDDAGIQDAGLCHGSAGLGHLYHHFYRLDGDERFAESARTWYRWTLEFQQRFLGRQEEDALAGFPAWALDHADPDKGLHWRPDPGFLTGTAGVGLALVAALSDVEPAWNRVLAMSLPPVGQRSASDGS